MIRAAVLLLASLACSLTGGCAGRSASAPIGAAAAAADSLGPAQVATLRSYIRQAWPALTRTLADLPRAARDEKMPPGPDGRNVVYVPAAEDLPALEARLARALPADALRTLAIVRLPPLDAIKQHGLLFLPNPYVVPGGRFNEMYGWDSYFVALGLLRDGQAALARGMVDNFLYQVRHYGGVLNANRTYYLTRSQPPLLPAMTLAVHAAFKDRRWLAAAYPALVADHAHWLAAPHLDAATGLSRYFDHGTGPAPEVVAGEKDALGQTHYDRVRAAFRARNDPALDRYYRRDSDQLTALFFEGDRAMRESGFDPTGRFGPYGAATSQIVPVCLNSLLYRMERDLAEIARQLERPDEAARFAAQAEARRAKVDAHLWDETLGLYLDYDLETKGRRNYPFATTFWPLWAGLASPAQGAKVRENLRLFLRAGGLRTSTKETGAQWDAPFGWAPLQLFAVEGLRRYGFKADADAIARAFLSMLIEDLARRNTLLEKYDVERRTSQVERQLAYGYPSNEIGFGWTNAVALELLAALGL